MNDKGFLSLGNSPEDDYTRQLIAQGLVGNTNLPKWATQGLLGNTDASKYITQGVFGGLDKFDWLGKGLLGNIF